MTTYNTGNPIGSKDPRDLYDNAENLDVLVNDKTKETHPDRLGQQRKTWHGMEQDFNTSQIDRQNRFNNFIASSGYQFLGDYSAGIEITEYNQIVRDADGEFWRLSGQVDLPYTTTGDWSAEVNSFVSVGDAALRQELANTSNTQNGAGLVGYKVPGGVSQTVNSKLMQSVSVVDYGAHPNRTRSQNSIAFAQAAAQAKLLGYSLSIPAIGRFPLSLIDIPDMAGVDVYGEPGAAVDGYFKNPGKVTGIIYGTDYYDQSTTVDLTKRRDGVLPSVGNDNKFIVNFASNDNVWAVCTRTEYREDRDCIFIMRRGNGGDGPDWEHIRSQQIYCGEAYSMIAAKRAAETGDWGDFSATPLQLGYPSGWGASFAGYNVYVIARVSTQSGAKAKITLQPDRKGFVRVSFIVNSIAAKAVRIHVDGVLNKTINTKFNTTRTRIRHIDIYVGLQDFAEVEIEHAGSTGERLYILGYNMHRPHETSSAIDYQDFALYWDTNKSYAGSVGAGDYAMSNKDIGFFGSYHGHELYRSPAIWRVDGSVIGEFTPAKPYTGRSIDLTEKTRIAEIVDADIFQKFDGNSRLSIYVTFSGVNGIPFEVNKMYLGMNGTLDQFTRVIFPEYAEDVQGEDSPDMLLGMTNLVVQERPDTGQVQYTYCNIQEGFPSAKGVFIKTLEPTGSSYQKVYYSWVFDSPMKIDRVAAQIIKICA